MKVKVTQLCPTLCDSMDLYSPWNSPGQSPGVGSSFPSPGDLLNPWFEPRSPTLQADSLPAEPPGKALYLCNLSKYFTTIRVNLFLSYNLHTVKCTNVKLII